jgi:dinuclear metal center YbgI/SA1388 family protein
MSFHTRLDAVEGGVNDTLANAIGLQKVIPFGQDGEEIGRIGTLKAPMSVAEFAALVKGAIGAEGVQAVDAGKPVYRVAVLGGSGSDDVKAARAAGADTYLSGELKHNWLTDAPDLGINLVAAGHFYTEDPVCRILRDMILNADQTVTVTVTNSNPVRVF